MGKIMKTYPIKIIREAFLLLVDTKKYVKFTVFVKGRRPLRMKAKIMNIWATKDGPKITFRKSYINRYFFGKSGVLVKEIRWITPPFDEEKLDAVCQQLIKRLSEHTGLAGCPGPQLQY